MLNNLQSTEIKIQIKAIEKDLLENYNMSLPDWINKNNELNNLRFKLYEQKRNTINPNFAKYVKNPIN